MTMMSLYIVYKTNYFPWTMSDNKAYLIFSYSILNTLSFAMYIAHSVTIWHITYMGISL